MSPDTVVVGRIVGVYGVKGWVKVFSHTDPIDNIESYRPWLLKEGAGWSEVEITGFRIQGKGLVAKFTGVDDRNAAELLVGRDIAVAADLLPRSTNDEYYWRDLLGLRVRHQDGRDLGSVHAMMETGANDVLVVRGDSNSLDRRERLIPWLPERVVLDVNLADGTLTVDWDTDF